jgi:hypothetical protein
MEQGNNTRNQALSISRLRGNQRGSVMITMAVSIVALFAFAIVAIDGAILMTTKTQLQNAADAACLACASGLATGGTVTEREVVAVARAIEIAGENGAIKEDLAPVVIDASDIEFLEDHTKCRVTTHRTEAKGDPLRTYFLKIIDLARPNTADVSAVATAEVFDICGTTCIKPWAVPDRWDDTDGDNVFDPAEEYTDSNGNGVYDAGEPFTDDDGDAVWDAAEYYDPIITGYLPPGDVGQPITLHADAPPGPVAEGHYYSINLPPLGNPEQAPLPGGDWYREWIRSCAPWPVAPGDSVQLEPGLMVGPTIQGILDLIAQDPLAAWDPTTKSIVDSPFGLSPRVALVPFYDPNFPPVSGRNYVKITKIGAFFMESVGPGSRVNARFIKIGVPGAPCDDPNAPPTFLIGLHLVE